MELEVRTVSCSMKRKVSAVPPPQDVSPHCEKSAQKMIREANRMKNEAIDSAISRFVVTDSFSRYGTAKDVGQEVLSSTQILNNLNPKPLTKSNRSFENVSIY